MKRLVSFVLALVLCLSLFSFASADGDVYRFDKQVTIKVSVFDRGTTGNTPADDNAWTKWIQENFGDPRNVKVEWVVIPRSEEREKLNILMADPSSAPTIAITYYENLVTNFVGMGGLYELTDLVAQYGSHLKSFLGEDVLASGYYNGGLYTIPARRIVIATEGMFIREDWLEELGLPMPTTTEEFYNTLVAFKAAKPDCIPYALSSGMTGHSQLKLSFIKDINDARTLACTPEICWDGYLDYVLFLNKLYNEGLVSPDFALNNDDALYAEISSGKAGGYTYNYDHPIRVSPGLLASLQAYEPNAKLSPLNCFESVTDSSKYYHLSYSPAGIQCFIPMYATEDEAKAAVMYLDWLCEYETIYFLQTGIEGHSFELNEAGIPVALKPTDEWTWNSMQNIDYTLLVNGQYLDDENLLIAAQATSYQGYADLFEEEYNVGNTDLILATNVHFDRVLEANSAYGETLRAYHNELMTKCVMAAPEDCEALFNSMVAEYMAMGGADVQAEKEAAWDANH